MIPPIRKHIAIRKDVLSSSVPRFLGGSACNQAPDSGRERASFRAVSIVDVTGIFSIVFLMIGASQLDWRAGFSGVVCENEIELHSFNASSLYDTSMSLDFNIDPTKDCVL